ncbi:hypothetical protein DYI25_15750 [Mesobacillus boroniphilus]|uniref:Uncharacterized protein n=1 Tax=Mesobacillus boroniphilus TaxID=308892 RepID=A0A944GYU5_9BACI|nr:hypothetical protein [Mesobacillus boroniphilus]
MDHLKLAVLFAVQHVSYAQMLAYAQKKISTLLIAQQQFLKIRHVSQSRKLYLPKFYMQY